MSFFWKTFKEQGGSKLLKNYWDNRVLFQAGCQLLLLGKSKKALEIIRLITELKINKRIKKEFYPLLNEFDAAYSASNPNVQASNKVWVYWSTGMAETAPELVKRCFQSLKDNLKDKEIILLSKKNYADYVKVPDYIVEKYEKGLIQHVHFADLLRIELLAQNGGTWIDSTVFCSGTDIPSYMMDSEFFIFQNLKPGADGHTTIISSWFIHSHSNHKFVAAQRFLMERYWKKYDKAIDYFFFHHLFVLVSEYYSEEWKKIIQYPNSFPHVLLLMMFEPFNKSKWDAITSACPFHKLNYKRSQEDMERPGTYYQYLMGNL